MRRHTFAWNPGERGGDTFQTRSNLRNNMIAFMGGQLSSVRFFPFHLGKELFQDCLGTITTCETRWRTLEQINAHRAA